MGSLFAGFVRGAAGAIVDDLADRITDRGAARVAAAAVDVAADDYPEPFRLPGADDDSGIDGAILAAYLDKKGNDDIERKGTLLFDRGF